MDTNHGDPPPLSFPDRMFAMGDEPLGIRVTPYHKPSCISKILNALDEEELRFVRESPFGKLVEIAEKPSFSGRIGRLLFSRLLKIRKKHEAWFLFAGKPIRFSIREFALVTGLNCRRYPPHSKKRSKKILSEKPYWGELFGAMTEVTVSSVVTMLKKKTVTDRGMRIKYALLSLLSAVILPTSHNPRILHAAAERIKDLDQFLAYPWGRESFDMLMDSIKERNEISLSQNTIAFKGFVMSIQLVLIEAVPSLMGVVRDGASSGSESESEADEESGLVEREGKISINTGHIRSIDAACKVNVVSIISDGVDLPNFEPGVGSEDEEDVLVDNLVKAAREGFSFSNSNFKGGATKADVSRMRDEAIKENNNRKTARANRKLPATEGVDAEYVASIVKNSLSADLSNMGDQIKDLALSLCNSQNLFQKKMEDLMRISQKEILDTLTKYCTRSHARPPVDCPPDNTGESNLPERDSNPFVVSDIIQEAMRFANKESAHTRQESRENVVGGQRGHPCDEDNFSEPLRSEEHEAMDHGVGDELNPNHGDREEDPLVAYMFNGEADDVGDVGACQDPITNSNVHGENLVEQVIAPPFNRSETIIEDPTNVVNANQEAVTTGLSFPDPSFSIGLTQMNKSNAQDVDHVAHPKNLEEPLPESNVDKEAPILNRKSKRAKVVPRNLVGDYQCDKRFLTRAWESFVNAICSTPSIDYAAKFALLLEVLGGSPFVIDFGGITVESSELSAIVDRSSHLPSTMMDVLIHHTRYVFLSNAEQMHSKNCVFLDTKFVSLLSKSFTKFSKTAKKDNFRFPPALCSFVAADLPIAEVNRFYFPFNFDKQHWVGVCVDVSLAQVIVLDCNTSLKTEAMVAADLRPITQMFPFIIRQAGKQLTAKEMKTLSIDRPRAVPQNSNLYESGITSVLLIQAHAVGGVDVCKCINQEVLDTEVQRVAVMMYEDNVAPL
ncbi:unnamed protein product [Brassica rapa]|uniref:Ubiquitin-like protease family profile domain-containing protein n=1 Tax=Brassica campestris TaxID=3711 RepID=A0A8D9DBN7_BRACM|nr:unnamed protein product [Brassica rapa]